MRASSVRQSFLYFLTVAFGQGLSFLLLPVVTRYLTPEAYGQYSLALVVASLVAMGTAAWVRNVGLRLYVDAAARGETRGFFWGTSLLQNLLFVVAYTLVLAILARTSIAIAPVHVMVWAGIAQVLSNQYTYTTTLLRAEQRAVPFAVAEIGAGVLRFLATIGGLLLGFATADLLFAATAFGFLIANIYATPALAARLAGRGWFDRAGTLELLRAGPVSLPFSLAGWLERLADRLVLAYYAGAAVVGVYSVGYAVGERLLGSLVQAVFMVAWPNILNGWRDGGAKGARDATASAQRLYLWITVGPTLFLVAYGSLLISWIAGTAFQEAAVVVPWIAASMWVGGFGAYINRQFELHKRYGRLSGISLVGAALNVVLNIVLIPRYGMTGAAAATLVNQVFNVVVFVLWRDATLFTFQARTFLAAVLLAAVAWGAAFLAGPKVLVGAIVFVVVYAVGALIALARIDRAEVATEVAQG